VRACVCVGYPNVICLTVLKGFALCRKGFRDIRTSAMGLVEALKARGSEQPVEMTNALMCTTLDMIGAFGMQYDVGAINALASSDKNYLLEV
jgi:hypothetical protein